MNSILNYDETALKEHVIPSRASPFPSFAKCAPDRQGHRDQDRAKMTLAPGSFATDLRRLRLFPGRGFGMPRMCFGGQCIAGTPYDTGNVENPAQVKRCC